MAFWSMSETDPTSWQAKAAEDLGSARVLLAAEPPFTENAAYFCQQCPEKLMKSVIVAAGRRPPHVHDLGRLAALAAEFRPDLGDAMKRVRPLTLWGVVIEGRDGVEVDGAE